MIYSTVIGESIYPDTPHSGPFGVVIEERNAADVAGCVLWEMSRAEEMGMAPEASHIYAAAMRELMPLVPLKTALQLAERYPLSDRLVYADGAEEGLGYLPAQTFLYDKAIPTEAKLVVARRWGDVAHKELKEGAELPQGSRRGADCMAEYVQQWVHGPDVDIEAHTELVRMLENMLPADQRYIAPFAVRGVAEYITDPGVLLDFVSRHFPVDTERELLHDRFRIMSEHDKEFVALVADIAAYMEQPYLVAQAHALVREYEHRLGTAQDGIDL